MAANSHVTASGHHVAHHFDDAHHEFDTCKNGMWMFLVQEVLFFSPLFVGYFIYRGMYPEAFKMAHLELSVPMGALNTVILITSSFTMAMAVQAAQRGLKDLIPRYMGMTLLCGMGFLVVKYFEYSAKFHHHLLPGAAFDNPDLVIPHANMFFTFYFCMTGLHGLHVLGGMIYMVFLMRRAMKKEFGPDYFTPVEMFGLYWHFVDLVWIFLFPILYLMG